MLEIFLKSGKELFDDLVTCWLHEAEMNFKRVLVFPKKLDCSEHKHLKLREIIEADIQNSKDFKLAILSIQNYNQVPNLFLSNCSSYEIHKFC